MSEASGFVLVDKPSGWTSHDVVARLRRLVGTRKIGHAGTLDPLATGLLICGVNRATRLLDYVGATDKTYLARLRFGVETISEDAAGEAVAWCGAAELSRADLVRAGQAFLGPIEQIPSAVSAVKVAGRRAYDLVRAGETPALASRPVRIDALDWGEPTPGWWECGSATEPSGVTGSAASGATAAGLGDPSRTEGVPVVDVDLEVTCSAGTYIRALARDLGRRLGVGAHLIALRRLRSGSFDVAEATVGEAELAADTAQGVTAIGAILTRVLPARTLPADLIRPVATGQRLELRLDGPTVLLDTLGQALAVYAPEGDHAKAKTVLVGGADG